MPIVTQFDGETSERIYVEILMAITKVAAHNGLEITWRRPTFSESEFDMTFKFKATPASLREFALNYCIDATQMVMSGEATDVDEVLADLMEGESEEDRTALMSIIHNTNVSDEAWTIVNGGEA